MKVETYIARRYLHSGRFFVNVSTWITVIGVTLGVAVVCFVMSMHNGFEREIRTRLLGTTSHVSVFSRDGALIPNYRALMDTLRGVPAVTGVSPFIYYKAAISSEAAGDGIVIRGVDPIREQLASNIESDITSGTYTFEPKPLEDDTVPGILLGYHLAERLGVFLDHPVVLYSLRGEDLRRNTRPRVAKFYVAGIFETGMYEFDAELAYISLESAQKLFQTGDAVTTLHLRVPDIYQAEHIALSIDSLLGHKYDVVPWNVLHRNLFSWIALEKKILFLGFLLIVIVAAFSIISTLVMTTMEKRDEIGILKTLGSTPVTIGGIFVIKGLFIGGAGVIGGWLLAGFAAWLQNEYKLVSLPPDIYFVSFVPIDVHPLDFTLAGLVTMLVCFLAALYPAWQASRLSVVDVLRE